VRCGGRRASERRSESREAARVCARRSSARAARAHLRLDCRALALGRLQLLAQHRDVLRQESERAAARLEAVEQRAHLLAHRLDPRVLGLGGRRGEDARLAANAEFKRVARPRAAVGWVGQSAHARLGERERVARGEAGEQPRRGDQEHVVEHDETNSARAGGRADRGRRPARRALVDRWSDRVLDGDAVHHEAAVRLREAAR
jgi:hypothetical protein